MSPIAMDDGSDANTVPKSRFSIGIVLLIIGAISLGTGINRYHAGAYCHQPLPVWLIVHSCLVISSALMLILRQRIVSAKIEARGLLVLSYVISGCLFLTTLGWLILGAVWTWGRTGGSATTRCTRRRSRCWC